MQLCLPLFVLLLIAHQPSVKRFSNIDFYNLKIYLQSCGSVHDRKYNN